MKTGLILLFYLFAFLITEAQTQNSWFELSTINNDTDRPFKPEKKIEGICFITPASGFNHYKKPILILEKGVEIVRIQFSESEGLVTNYRGRIYFNGDSTNEFRPWLFNDDPNNFALALECTDTSGAFYKVRLNASDIAFISKRNPGFRKISVENFIMNWTRGGFDFDRSTNPMRAAPSITSAPVVHPDEGKFKIWPAQTMKVEGEWMEVVSIKGEQAWIRWKNGDHLLIRMYFQFQQN